MNQTHPMRRRLNISIGAFLGHLLVNEIIVRIILLLQLLRLGVRRRSVPRVYKRALMIPRLGVERSSDEIGGGRGGDNGAQTVMRRDVTGNA